MSLSGARAHKPKTILRMLREIDVIDVEGSSRNSWRSDPEMAESLIALLLARN